MTATELNVSYFKEVVACDVSPSARLQVRDFYAGNETPFNEYIGNTHMAGGLLTSLEMNLLRSWHSYVKKAYQKKRLFLGNTLDFFPIVSPLQHEMWKIQYTHFVTAPGIAVAISIMVSFRFWQGVPATHCGGQSTQKVFPQKYTILQLSAT